VKLGSAQPPLPGQFSRPFSAASPAANLVLLCGLEHQVEKTAQSAETQSQAAAWAQAAAHFAQSHHCGVFASVPLEQALHAMGRHILWPPLLPGSRETQNRPVEHVLHVFTEGYEIGGHTGSARRWIHQDSTRRHSLVLTNQTVAAAPAALTEAVQRSGGQTHSVSGPPDLILRARILRTLASVHDLVCLHIHPYDIVPALAFACPQRPPVTVVDHADYGFWVGAAVCDVLSGIRAFSSDLAVERRGIPRARCAEVPILIEFPAPARNVRAETRAALGIADDTILLFTAGTAHKYIPIGKDDFLDFVTPVVREQKNLVLIAVGPHDWTPRWQEARVASCDRIRAIGTLPDLSGLLQAADIYLDSFPLSGGSMALQAGSYGLPVLYYQPPSLPPNLWAAPPPALDATLPSLDLLVARDQKEHRQALSALVADPVLRQELGKKLQRSVATRHCGARWQEHLENLYNLCRTTVPVAWPECPARLDTESAMDHALAALHPLPGLSTDLAAIFQRHMAHISPYIGEESLAEEACTLFLSEAGDPATSDKALTAALAYMETFTQNDPVHMLLSVSPKGSTSPEEIYQKIEKRLVHANRQPDSLPNLDISPSLLEETLLPPHCTAVRL